MHKPGFGTGGPDPLNSTPSPPPLKKRNPLNLDLPWSGGFLDPGIITPLLLSKLGRKFTPVKALVKEYHFGIMILGWIHDYWVHSEYRFILYLITQLYLITHLIPDKHKKLFADLKKIHDDILNIRILI